MLGKRKAAKLEHILLITTLHNEKSFEVSLLAAWSVLAHFKSSLAWHFAISVAMHYYFPALKHIVIRAEISTFIWITFRNTMWLEWPISQVGWHDSSGRSILCAKWAIIREARVSQEPLALTGCLWLTVSIYSNPSRPSCWNLIRYTAALVIIIVNFSSGGAVTNYNCFCCFAFWLLIKIGKDACITVVLLRQG